MTTLCSVITADDLRKKIAANIERELANAGCGITELARRCWPDLAIRTAVSKIDAMRRGERLLAGPRDGPTNLGALALGLGCDVNTLTQA